MSRYGDDEDSDFQKESLLKRIRMQRQQRRPTSDSEDDEPKLDAETAFRNVKSMLRSPLDTEQLNKKADELFLGIKPKLELAKEIVKKAEAQQVEANTATPDDAYYLGNSYYVNQVINGIILIILLAGFFLIKREVRPLWIILFGTLFLGQLTLNFFNTWIRLARNTTDGNGKTYEDIGKYSFMIMFFLFVFVVLGLIIYMGYGIVVWAKKEVSERKISSSENHKFELLENTNE